MTDPINPIQNGAKNRSDQSTNWQSSVDRNFTKKLRRRLYGIYMIYTPRIQHGIFFSSRTIILQNTVWFKTYGVHQHRLSSNQNMPHKMTTILNCVEHVWTTKEFRTMTHQIFFRRSPCQLVEVVESCRDAKGGWMLNVRMLNVDFSVFFGGVANLEIHGI